MRQATPFGFALALAAVSGAAALMHELLWTRRLVDLLGASAESETRVLGCFFVGLAVGAALAQRLWPSARRPWRIVALIELGIALAVVPALTLPAWTAWLWPALGPDRLVSWPGAAVKLVASALVVLPPAVLMGMTLPLMGKAVLVGERQIARHGIWLYATNTAGGVVGLLLATIITVPELGVAGSMGLALALNVVVALGALAASRREVGAAAVESDSSTRASTVLLAIAAFSGAGVLSLEILALHLLRQVVPSSFYAINAILAATLVALAVSAALVPLVLRGARRVRIGLWGALLATSLATVAVPVVFVRFTDGLRHLDGGSTLLTFELEVIGIALVTVGPALLLAGLVLPTVFALLSSDHGDRHGRQWGVVLAANGVGGLVGAELTHRFLIPAAGFYEAAAVIAVVYAVAALALAVGTQRGRLRLISATSSALAVAAVVLVATRLASGLPEMWAGWEYRLLSKETGREGLVAVVEHDQRGRGIAMNNLYFLGGTAARYDEKRQGHLPLVLHPQPRDVLFIGLATGLTAVSALDHPDVESVTVVELSELVVRASREHFSDVAQAIHTSPRARVVVEDGRTFVASTQDRFDVVVSDLFLPWRAGVGRLYSVEHYEAVRAALRDGGLFAQWLPAHQLSRSQLDVVLATMGRVFPRIFLFRGNFSVAAMPLAVVALRDDAGLGWDGLDARVRALRASGVRDPLMRHAEGVGLLYLGSLRRDSLGAIAPNTLGNAWLETDAGRLRVSERRADEYLVHERWLAAETSLAVADGPSLPSLDVDALRSRGRAIVSVPRNRSLTDVEKVDLRTKVLDGFPGAMVQDPGADWEAARVLRQLLDSRRRKRTPP